MNGKALDILGYSICTRWNFKNANLKKDLIDYLEYLLGADIFNKGRVTSVVDIYLKYVRDMYRVHLKYNPMYENP